nr:regulator of G-protein signaling 9-binding protein-like [Dromaius novaehollandiae]
MAGAFSVAGACAAALSTATAGHRQLVLQLGGSADCAQLREELRRSSARARELSAGLRSALVAGLQHPPASPEERRELERLWVLFLSALELLLRDLRREVEQVRAMLAEMESRANIPVWAVEAGQRGRAGGSGGAVARGPRPGTGLCCTVL